MLIPRSREKHPRSFMKKTTAETLRGVYPERTAEILRGVYPERTAEILRFAQNDKRRAQDDTGGGFFSILRGV